ncbi:hypothetical protein SAMN04487764_1530 [Gillisia sp. Hel1_33_143]|uniref:hypothetical protein n=1 Tax=Gillisia sp. Hel1_33_143 TaxID=1336796 RepID=UPI00087ABEE9|nr:hypothetical protein [Gillisia sp. Hel1_33_143]SDS13494.1 hypothetical protein SAMN04487764_1530 [Gillisia sp. Hel1_33_143]
MAKILKVTIEEQFWNTDLGKHEKVIKEYDRKTYDFDFDNLLLENIDNSEIEDYAGDELSMVDANDAECNCSISDHQEYEIISYLEEQGYEVIKCQTIVDKMRLDKIKEALEL